MPKCSVPGCLDKAAVEVRLYDVYLHGPEPSVFDERDFTCPYLCGEHFVENEHQANGARRPRGYVEYPYTNRHHAQGFTVYRNLDATRSPRR